MAGDGNNAYARRVATGARQRCVAGIMKHAEDHLYVKMSPGERKLFRDKVLSAVGAYHDCVLDLLRASIDDGSVMVNEHALAAIARLNGLADVIEEMARG